MKFFVLSDIHGHYAEMLKEIKKTDFDVNNDNHKLVINGDMFDRGKESREVFEYLYPLNMQNKAIIIKGNHEFFLEDFINGDKRSVLFNCFYNGFNETLLSFIPDYNQLTFNEARNKFIKKYPFFKSWLTGLPYYYETKNYVITHAGLDFSQGDFRSGDFKNAVWMKSEEFFTVDLVKEYNFNKTVIVGHRFTCMLRKYFNPSAKVDYGIYVHDDKQKIGIDGGVYYSKQINVFVFEDELI